MKSHKNLINGEWVASKTGKVFRDVNPSDRRDVIGLAQRSGPADIEWAVRAAREALPAWMAMPAPKRAMILFKSAQILEERKEELSLLMIREMGKTLKETRGDVQEAIDTAYFFAGEGRRLYGHTVPSELKNKMCLTVRRPIGVCGLITPWNFPLAIPSWKVYPALICGNTVVLKPAEDTPILALLFGEILMEAGLPKGVCNVVTGFGEEAGAALVKHRDVSMISFTGSSKVGSLIAASCGKNLKRVSLEMGGKNPQIVLEDADLPLAVDAALWGAFATSGQRCTATSRVIVHQKVYDRFLRLFLERVKKVKVGPASDPSTEVGPIINPKQLRQIHRHVQRARREGAKLVCGGKIDAEGDKKNGSFYRPTVFTNVSPKMKIAQEEVFGPVVAFIKVKDYEEAVRVVNDSFYGLSSSVFTRDVSRAIKSVEGIQSGITYINASTIGAEAHLPFGGVKRSGHGQREAGVTALDIFSEWKTIYIDYSGRVQRAQID
ncbi:MAG: aldehyde dehydrogenase family protein [Candidatus Omnitrophota bacterium]